MNVTGRNPAMLTCMTHRDDSATPVWSELPTERRHPDTMSLDTTTTDEAVRILLREDRRGIDAALEQSAVVARTADRVAATLTGGGRVLFAGAGTSGRLGVLEAAECPPTFGTDPDCIGAVIAGGRKAVFAAREGAEDVETDGRSAVAGLGPDDLLIAISASSVTPFVRGALSAAREAGSGTVLLTCASGNALQGLADELIALDTGPEVLTGSTRLKAGSATKAVLNAITTAAMIRLGKVFENLMVDLRQGSAKLQDRAVRIVAETTELPSRIVRELLEQADHEVKTAIVMARLDVDAQTARRRLQDADGHVRRALSDAG